MALSSTSSEGYRDDRNQSLASAATDGEGIIGSPGHVEDSIAMMSEQKGLGGPVDPVQSTTVLVGEDTTMEVPSSPLSEALSDVEMGSPARSMLPLTEKDTNASMPATNTNGVANSNALTLPGATKAATKRKLTAAEKEAQEKERELKKQKKADEAQAKEAAKLAKANEKAKADAEREAKKAAKAAEKAEADAKKAVKAAEKADAEAKKEAARKQKEEQEQALQRKKAKQQNMLAAFVKRAPTTPAKPSSIPDAISSVDVDTPSPTKVKTQSAPQQTAYSRLVQPFFLKKDVTLAPQPFHMDDDTRAAKSSILDDHVYQKRGTVTVTPFDAAETFQVHQLMQPRGMVRKSVKEIMDAVYGGNQSSAFSAAPKKSESQTANELVSAQAQLNLIPMKILKFYEDVRPPYIGTMTASMEPRTLRKLSRRPLRRGLTTLNYDYDSEAEWQDDDGEDLLSEDEEEELDGDDEIDDFLDDSDDMPAMNRPSFLGNTEPEVLGPCFEEKGVSPCAAMNNFKIEFLLENMNGTSIDPFSTSYWEKPKRKAKEAPPSMLAAATANNSTLNATKQPTHAFAVLIKSNGAGSAKADPPATIDSKDMVAPEILDEFKRAIVSDGFREHTKLTIIDLLSKKFTSCTKPQVKKTLEHIAVRQTVPGEAKSCKHWQLLPAFSL